MKTNFNKEKLNIGILPSLEIDSEGEFKLPKYGKYSLDFFYDVFRENNINIFLMDYNSNINEMIEKMDGWLIPGGPDINPKYYNQKEIHQKTYISKFYNMRFEKEVEIYKNVPKEMPILGICYGSQAINVLEGGTLDQHLDEVSSHIGHPLRDFVIKNETKLSKAVDNEVLIKGNCYHHQGIKDIGKNLIVSAYDKNDKLIHGIEINDPERWVVGVLWHPERNLNKDTYDRNNLILFNSFLEKCVEYKNKKNNKK